MYDFEPTDGIDDPACCDNLDDLKDDVCPVCQMPGGGHCPECKACQGHYMPGTEECDFCRFSDICAG